MKRSYSVNSQILTDTKYHQKYQVNHQFSDGSSDKQFPVIRISNCPRSPHACKIEFVNMYFSPKTNLKMYYVFIYYVVGLCIYLFL